MARKIKFPLKMKNGAEVRTLDQLKENFDLESVLGYFVDGRLLTWLADRYYDEKASAVSSLSVDMPDLNSKLCEILEINYQPEDDAANLEYVQRRNEKLKILNAFTDDKEILNNIDLVAMNQNELFDILDEKPDKIYLYGDKFSIPFGAKNICYIGVNQPFIILETDKSIGKYEEVCIKFQNIRFENNANLYVSIGEKIFLEGKYQEAFPIIEQAANNGNPRAMFIMALYYSYGYEVVKINKKERDNWCERAYLYKEPLSMYAYAAWCLNDGSDEQKSIYALIFKDIQLLAESGDSFAQGTIGGMYDAGNGIDKDNAKAVEWYRKAAEQGDAIAQCNLGYMYDSGYGVGQDYSKAIEWYEKAAKQGLARAQCNLGYMYDRGHGVFVDKGRAKEWYIKAKDNGSFTAKQNLELLENKGIEYSEYYDLTFDAAGYNNCSWIQKINAKKRLKELGPLWGIGEDNWRYLIK